MSRQPSELRAKTAEDLQKEAITFRWIELTNAAEALAKTHFSHIGSTVKAMSRFIGRLYGFYYATRFYVDDHALEKVEQLFSKVKGNADITVEEVLTASKEYADACYKKGLMFIKEEVTLEEGFKDKEEAVEVAA